MKATTAPNLVKTTFATFVLASILTGCGGSGAGVGGNTISTKLASNYKMTVVHGPAGSQGFEFTKISPNGMIAGRYSLNGKRICFVYKDGQRTDLTPTNRDCEVMAVHDDGTIDGSYQDSGFTKPFTTAGGTYTEIPLEEGYAEGEFRSRDNKGNSYLSFFNMGESKSLRKGSNQIDDLTVSGATANYLSAVSPGGVAAGFSKINGQYQATVFALGSNIGTALFSNLSNVQINAINDSMNFGGTQQEGPNWKAYVDINGQHLVAPPMTAQSYYATFQGINEGNVAVGTDQSNLVQGIGWSQTDGFIKLNDRIEPVSAVAFRIAKAIDNHGMIAGIGTENSEQVGILLTPTAH